MLAWLASRSENPEARTWTGSRAECNWDAFRIMRSETFPMAHCNITPESGRKRSPVASVATSEFDASQSEAVLVRAGSDSGWLHNRAMNVHGVAYRSIWPVGQRAVGIIDQTRLPYEFCTLELVDSEHMVTAIASMQVRGAPLIGVAAAYGIALAMNRHAADAPLDHACEGLLASRPTAVNLRWAVQRMR